MRTCPRSMLHVVLLLLLLLLLRSQVGLLQVRVTILLGLVPLHLHLLVLLLHIAGMPEQPMASRRRRRRRLLLLLLRLLGQAAGAHEATAGRGRHRGLQALVEPRKPRTCQLCRSCCMAACPSTSAGRDAQCGPARWAGV